MSFKVPEGAQRLAPGTVHTAQTSEKLFAFREFVHRISPAVQVQAAFGRKKQDLKEPNSTTEKDESTILSQIPRKSSVQLEEELSLTQLKKLMKLFKQHRPKRVQKSRSLDFFSPKPLRDEKPGLMDVQDFRKALTKALQLEDELLNGQVEKLFRNVDISSDGLVDWDELSSYILLRLREKDVLRSADYGKVLNSPPKIVKIERSKEPTSRILTVFNPTRYITVSKDGIIRVWNTKLALQRSLIMEDGNRSLVHGSSTKRYVKMWVTDAVVMENVSKMAVCTTNMDIYFYDMSTPVYTPQFHLCGLGAVSFCMDYHYNQKNLSDESLLFYGDNTGCVHLLIFHAPRKGLFETPFKKSGGSHTVFLQDLSSHSDLVTHVTMDEVHSDWVRRLRYYSCNDILISCSGNGEDTLLVRSIKDKALGKTYIYKVPKGIDCFDYCKEINIIATGGMDHVVRLWNPYVTIKPVAKLDGHTTRVIDVVIHEKMQKLFSYDSDTVLKTWDIKEHHCLQSVHLKYPFTHHRLEHGPFPVVLLSAPNNSLLIACEDYLTEMRLQDDELKNQRKQTSHEKPICAVLYNAKKKQVITGCEDSIVRTWDVETGRKVFEFVGTFEEEMSCMALEESGRRLFTGSRNGMVYIWSAGNGHLLHKCIPEKGYECEVTGIQPLPERSYTLSVGWSRRMIMYHDSAMLTVPADPSWKGGHIHEDDILCIAHCSPNLVATGSFDGDLNLWSLERQNIFKRLKRGSGSLFKSKIKKIGLTNNRKRSKQENKHGVPIDALLFFERRARVKEQDNAILVSSQAGVLELWSMFGPLRPRGYFYAPSEPGCTVLALATDQDNNILVSGDSSGYITVWDVHEYCTMRLELSVAKMWATPKRQTSQDVSDTPPPPQQHKWQGHTKAAVSLKVINHLQPESLLLSASTDCTAKLWTINGDLIGVFDQGQTWNLRSVTEPFLTQNGNLGMNDDSLPGESEKNLKTDDSESENPNRDDAALHEEFESNISLPGSKIRPHTSGEVIRPISPYFHEHKFTKCDSKCVKNVEPLGIERSLTEWSILGDKYNRTFERRMVDRRNRRDNMGHVDTTLTKGGGLGSSCSPFQALHVTRAKEFALPRDLPMTPRMVSRSKLSPDETWQRNLSSFNLPPILLEEGNFQNVTTISTIVP